MSEILYYETHIKDENAKWVVFIHGAGGSILTWKYQKEAFKPYFNLLFIDLRDHGNSKNIAPEFKDYSFDIICDDIINVLEFLDIHKAHFISLSLGSIILQKLDQKKPALIDRMIMAGGVFKADIKIKLFVHSARFLNHFLPYRVMYDLFSLIVLPKKNHRPSRRLFRLQSRKLSSIEYLKWVELYKEFFILLRSYFDKQLEKFCLIVMGEEDHVFLKAAAKFSSRHQLAKLEIIEKSGHVCNIEQHERFNSLVLKFLLNGTK